MSTTNKKYLDYNGLSKVADKVKERLLKVTTMPISPSINDTVLYVGTNSGSYVQGNVYQWDGTQWNQIGGGGHIMSPTPVSDLTEATIVTAVNGAQDTNDNVPSLYGIQKWTNTKTIRRIMTGTQTGSKITATGIGTWDDSSTPDETDWWQDAAFIIPDNADNIDISIKWDPAGDDVGLGGYIWDTTTGKICIKFSNRVTIATCRIAVDITYTRNEVA